MLFRQLYDATSSTYSYLLASRVGGEALIIDPVLERVDRYIQLLADLDLKLVKAVDTHLHADHVTGLGGAARPDALHHRDGRAQPGRRRLDAGRGGRADRRRRPPPRSCTRPATPSTATASPCPTASSPATRC